MVIQSEKEDITQSIQEKVEVENPLEEFQAILKKHSGLYVIRGSIRFS